jgi:hypothetical protein
MATGYFVGVLFSTGETNFSFLHSIQTSHIIYPASYAILTADKAAVT